MELSIVSVTIFVTFITLVYFLLSKKRPKNFPPGPTGIPIFGNIFQLGTQGYQVCLEMSEKYGDVIGIQFGSKMGVVLNNVDDMKEAFSRNEFTGRRMYTTVLDQNCDETTPGLIMSEGKIWLEQRRFCLKTLRDFGFGRKTMETIIMEEANDLIEEFRKTEGQALSTGHIFNCSVFNVIWSIVAGERYPRDDPQLEELMNLLIDLMKSASTGIKPFFFIFPGLVKIKEALPFLFPDGSKFRKKAFAFFRKAIQNHKDTIEIGNPRDLIDTYLEEVAKTTDSNSSFYPKGSDDVELIMVLADLFVAGAETTSTTLIWSFFLLALHKDTQEKFYKEIQTVVGNRQVSLTDKPSLPYIEATLMEIMRVSCLAPLAVPHCTTQDTTFKNFFIPKHTTVFSNVYAAHYRTSIWGDPKAFRPERFLSEDGKTVIKNKNWLPFGIGKRACLGEILAKDELFLFLTNLVQTFQIGMPEDEPEHTLRLIPGAVTNPEPHRIVLKERHT